MALPVAERFRKATTFLLASLLWLHALFFVEFRSPLLDGFLRALRFTTSEAVLFSLLLALSFLTGSGFWRLVKSLAYIYFFPFVLLGYAGYLGILLLRSINRFLVSPKSQPLTDSQIAPKECLAATQQAPPSVSRKESTGETNPRDVLRFMSRPFRRFAILWGILLVTSTHLVIVWLCLVVVLAQLARKMVTTLRLLLFSEQWLSKYGPLMFAGLDKTLSTLDALKPDLTAKKEFEGLVGQLKLWRKILNFLRDQDLIQRWGVVIAVLVFSGLYAYFSFLFSFAYFGVARVSAYPYSWPESVVTSMFIPAYASTLPNVIGLRVLGGIHFVLVVAVGFGTVMNFMKRKLDAVGKAATAYSERLSSENVQGKILVLESKLPAVASSIDVSNQVPGSAKEERAHVEPNERSAGQLGGVEPSATGSSPRQLQQVAQAVNQISVVVSGFQDAEIAAHDQALIPDDTHRFVQTRLLTLAQGGKASNFVILNASDAAEKIARVNSDIAADDKVTPKSDVDPPD